MSSTEEIKKKSKASSQYFYGVGRRKRSTARSKYFPGSKDLVITVNKKPIGEYFSDFFAKTIFNATVLMGVSTGKINIFVKGGGNAGQAEAARLAIAKSLLKSDEAYRPVLRMHGFLTTDIRKVLPKKAGRRKARKIEQWSKR